MSKTYNVYMLVASGFESEEEAHAFIDSDSDFSDCQRYLMRVVDDIPLCCEVYGDGCLCGCHEEEEVDA